MTSPDPSRRTGASIPRSSVLVLAVALASTTPVLATTDFVQTQRRVDVADGVIAFVAAESPGAVVQGNITAIVGRDATLVVDTGQYPSLARDVRAALAAADAPPVRYVVNTHWHGDHLLSNDVFADAVVIQHAETARVGAKTYADWSTTGIRQTRDYVTAIDKALASGKTSQGKPVTDEMRATFGTDRVLATAWLAQADETRWSAPDLTFDDALTLDLGDRKVALRHLGKANTTGDVTVFDERTKTLVTGDVVVHPVPYSFGSYHSEWIGVLAAMRALAPRHIVPGHGEVMHDDRYLARLEALLAATRAEVRAAIAKGESLEAMREHITLAAFEREFAGDDPARIRGFRGFYLEPALTQAYKEAKGEPRSE